MLIDILKSPDLLCSWPKLFETENLWHVMKITALCMNCSEYLHSEITFKTVSHLVES